MSKIYDEQTDLTIKLDTGKNLTGSTAKIMYKKPDATVGEWVATIETPSNGIISYSIIEKLGMVGTWTIWAKVTNNSLISIGDAVKFMVYKTGH